MRKFSLLFGVAILLICCKDTKLSNDTLNTWANAQWIAFEQLEDSMKVVPAVHGAGNKLGDKCIKRSVVPVFRKEFNLTNNIESASINICGLGHYELYINGDKIGDRFLSPGWTNYQKRYLYNTYDITKHIKKGDNAIGAMVGNGFYNVNLEQEGWNTPGFHDSKWQKPVIISDSIGKLVPEEDYPLKVMQEFKPRKVFISGTGRTIYDFDQNASGIISLKVQGNKGARIRIRPDELIDNEGNITQHSGGGPYEFNYTLKGEGVEEWQPRFTYYGFRYADVEIIEPEDAYGKTEILELKMLHTRNSSPTVGSFSCSDTLFNQIFELINWAIKSNMASV